ncbi:MAG TPA: hypothetical protein DC049_00815 [Spirochaetia bacterium]|nr:hypothetical protein [Spirochaetia bacterium]
MSGKKVLLTSTSFEKTVLVTAVDENSSGVQMTENSHYPLGLGYLHSFLEKNGFNVETAWLNMLSLNICREKLFDKIESFRPDVIGLQILTPNRVSSINILNDLFNRYNNLLVVAGGIHATVMYEQLLRVFPRLIIVLGEGEYTYLELLTDNKLNPANIPGIAFTLNGKVLINPRRELISDLDSLPFPKHSAFWHEKREVASIITSRGCPFACSFCSLDNISQRRIRFRSISNVIEEIKFLISSFKNLKAICIHDDCFLLNTERAIDFCREIINLKPNIDFYCSARLKPLTPELVIFLEKANFRLVMFGLETGDENILRKTNKKITIQDAENAISLFRNSKIDIYMFLIVGLPGETNNSINNTIKFIRKLQRIKYIRYTSDIALLGVYPGTSIYTDLVKAGKMDDEFWLKNELTPLYTQENDLQTLFYFKQKLINSICIDRFKTLRGFSRQITMLFYIIRYILKEEKFYVLRDLIPEKIFNHEQFQLVARKIYNKLIFLLNRRRYDY